VELEVAKKMGTLHCFQVKIEFGVLVLWRMENQRDWRKTLTAR